MNTTSRSEEVASERAAIELRQFHKEIKRLCHRMYQVLNSRDFDEWRVSAFSDQDLVCNALEFRGQGTTQHRCRRLLRMGDDGIGFAIVMQGTLCGIRIIFDDRRSFTGTNVCKNSEELNDEFLKLTDFVWLQHMYQVAMPDSIRTKAFLEQLLLQPEQ